MWVTAVQLRQHVSHRRTLFYLEQIILKHDAAVRAINIKPTNQGIDFFFDNRSHAMNFVNFLGNFAPLKNRHDKQLVSRDSHSYTYNYRYTLSVEICPICREDLIYLPPKVSANLGNLGPLVISTKVKNGISLLDPFTLRNCFLSADLTYLGNVLKAGDFALGYDIGVTNSNDIELEMSRNFHHPDAILIEKIHGEPGERDPGNKNESSSHLSLEYQEFLRDLEDNSELRINISLSRNTECHSLESTTNVGNVPCVPPVELFEDLDLSEEEDGEDSMRE
ncbi:60S ribosomal export protein NMD3 [Quillaja saponaria]|uniref:60S ribosomal export protein NMD3 n=1 Tax=Quillaja saponaria TaxID=32244 RepID=A0AAD7PUB4_QUISA|nr:60S ribosomal export protein NMD3 [Quillaja saponaria]